MDDWQEKDQQIQNAIAKQKIMREKPGRNIVPRISYDTRREEEEHDGLFILFIF